MKLTDLQPGESAIVMGVETNDGSTLKLMTLGVVEGSVIRCVSKLYESMEVDIYGAHFAISNYTAEKFICKKYDDNSKNI